MTATAKPKLTKGETQVALLALLGFANIMARLTPSQKDDAMVGLLTTIVVTPELFDQLWQVIANAQAA